MIIVLATRNAHKVGEIRAILGNGARLLALNEFPGAPEVIEDAGTFAGNAAKKAIELAKFLGRRPEAMKDSNPIRVLADDSGLEVDALDGAPGVHSARFAAFDSGAQGNSSDAENKTKLLRLLEGVPEPRRTARFRCVIALTPVTTVERGNASPVCSSDEAEMQTELFEGVCEGRVAFEPNGQGGFGYDPLFIPAGYAQSFAELAPEIKNQLSHRGKALEKLAVFLRSNSIRNP